MKLAHLPVPLSAIVLGLAPHVSSQAYDYGFQVPNNKLQEVLNYTDGPLVVGGLTQGWKSDTVPVRQEIRQLEQDPELWTLYLLGLSMMQYTDQSELLSYYQIAGIHGVPFVPWNGVNATPGDEANGYCTHDSILFLTWHRPYLALYEQVLFKLIQYIASLYPDEDTRARYSDAAHNFRIPYMDWAAQPPTGEGVLPESVGGSPQVNVSGPNGAQVISNPLFTYQFKPLDASQLFQAPFNKYLTTVRSPDSTDSSAGSNNTQVSLTLNQNFQSVQERLYHLFSDYHNYTEFSNSAWFATANSSRHDSLESLHDTLHSIMGGTNGHMAYISYAAFDPIFFLHHAMVDRVFTLWQILNPDSWVVPTVAAKSTFTMSQGQVQDDQTALTPFYNSTGGTFWTSVDARNVNAFGYTYDDIESIPLSSLEKENTTAQEEVRALVNSLYGSSSPATLGIIGPDGDTRRSVRRKDSSGFGPYKARRSAWALGSPKTMPLSVVQGDQYREWVVNIHAEKQGLGGTFKVHMFFGDPPADTTTWAYASNLVGTMTVFASLTAGTGANGTHVSGTVPLTAALAQQVGQGTLTGLQTAAVEPFLRKTLKFGVVQADGTEVPSEKVPGLGIVVVSAEVKVPSRMQELPQWGAMESQFDLC